VWLAIVGGVAYGLHRLEPLTDSRLAHVPPRLEIDWPFWLTQQDRTDIAQIQAEICYAAGLAPDDNLAASDLCARIAVGLAACPWVDSVENVKKYADGTIRVSARFREPLTMVRSEGVAYLVDRYGVRLPRYRRAAFVDPSDWLLITGVRAPVPEVGQPWPGDDLRAGLELVRFLQRAEVLGQLPFRSFLRAIDVSNFNGQANPRAGRIQIQTVNADSPVEWGLPPGEEYEIESPAARKLAVLGELYARFGKLPDRGPIDVRAHDHVLLLDRTAQGDNTPSAP